MTHCKAKQYGDTTICTHCAIEWDTNDPHPPACSGQGISSWDTASVRDWRAELIHPPAFDANVEEWNVSGVKLPGDEDRDRAEFDADLEGYEEPIAEFLLRNLLLATGAAVTIVFWVILVQTLGSLFGGAR